MVMKKIIKIIIIIFSSILVILLGLFYGPWHGFRDFWITTAMTTKSHQYLATILYSDKLIEEVLNNNKVIEVDEGSDTDLIDIVSDKANNNIYKDEYDRQVLEHNEGDIYKYFKVEGYNFDAYMAVIYKPENIHIVHTKYLGYDGEYLVDMAKREGGIVAINGGGFMDQDGVGSGGQATGIIIKDGKIIQASSSGSGVIGLTYDNKLYLGYITASEAINMGIRDAIEFGPFLIVNGKKADIRGNGGYGIHPRSAIGQRKDGIVLFLVIDGRRVDSMGASIRDVMDIMDKYGAYNTANLDGGNSSVLVINDKIVNRPIDWYQREQTRKIATGFIVKK